MFFIEGKKREEDIGWEGAREVLELWEHDRGAGGSGIVGA